MLPQSVNYPPQTLVGATLNPPTSAHHLPRGDQAGYVNVFRTALT